MTTPTRPPKLNTPRLRAALADAGLPVEDQPSDRTLQRWIYGHAMPPSWAVAAVVLRALGTRTLDEALAEMVAREIGT